MSEPLIHVTVHDQFKRGDRVRHVHADHQNREFVTESTLVVERDSTSITFANVPSRAEFEVIVDRVETSGPASIELHRTGDDTP